MFNGWHRAQKLFGKACSALQVRSVERTNDLEKANQDLKAAQAELQKRWQYLAEAQKLSHSGTFGWKVRTGELIWSEETYRILGFARETNPTLDLVFDRIHPEDRERMQELRDRAAQNGTDLDVEHRILLPDGVIRYVHAVAHAGRDSSGNLEYMGVVTDITERKRAEEERRALSRNLKESKARLEEAQRVAHIGHFYSDLIANRVTWSDELYRIYGLTPREGFIDRAMVHEMFHPDDRDYVLRAVEEAVRDGVHIDVEHRVVRPDGEVRAVQGLGTVKRDASGRAYEMFGTVQDITDRKRAEEERQALSRDLKESKAWLKEAQRVAHVGYWVWDLETNHLIWSDETYRIFGLSPQEGLIDFDKVREMIHPDDREAVFRTADEAIRYGTRADCEHRLFRPNGEMRVVHSLADLKRDALGQPKQMFGTTQDITDRKRAEEALRRMSHSVQESNARLEEAQRIAHVGHWEWKIETGRLTWSDETYRIYGMAPQERPIDIAILREMIHPEDRESMFRKAEESLLSGVRADAEHRIVRPSGEVRTVHSRADAKRDASGRPYEMFGTVQDITERKRAEQALQHTQIYLREGQRLARMGSWAFNDEGLYWSDELYQIFGLDPEKGAPKIEQYLSLIHPLDQASMAETIKTMFKEHCGCDVTKRIVRPDGQVRYVRCVASPVIEQEVFKGFLGTAIDVTEQELLTRQLRREQAYLAEAQSLAHIGSWATNFATRQNFHLSDETYRIHGFDPHQGPPGLERFWATLHPQDEPLVRATLEDAVRAGTDYDIRDFRICRADDGQIRFLRTIGHRNPAGEIGEYVGITMDITELKRAEEERERLRQLEADLAHINRVNMMGELAAALAHEIKQPIAAAVTNAGACLRFLEMERPDILEAREAASGTIGCATRAAEIIDRVRALFKKTAPQREPVNINELIREIALLLQNEIRRHSVAVHLGLAENLPEVIADRVQLQQVLMNLMLNAIEAMQGVSAHLEINSQQTDDGLLLIAVSDTGLGLPTEKADQIFDAFFTTKPQGTGMGLAISRSIVESHGGRLWASSNSGRGATFRFTLPYEESLRT